MAPGAGELTLGALAERVGGEARGDARRPIVGVRALADAGPGHLSLLTHPRYRDDAIASRAGALLVPAAKERLVSAVAGRDLLLVGDPARALTVLLPLFHPPRRPPPGIHPTAIVGAGCAIDASAHVGPYAVIGDGSRVGPGAAIEALAVVGEGCVIGAGARLHPHAVLYDGCEVGAGSEVHSGAVLGADGFGYASRGAGSTAEHTKVPQVGTVVLGADVEVGANTTIDRGALGATRVGAGSKIDNLVQVGHNCRLGRGVLLSGQTGLAGSAVLGDGVIIGGRGGSAGHLEIGAGTQVAATSVVMQSVPEGSRLAGVPATDLRSWQRQVALIGRLEELAKRLKALERRLDGGPVAPDGDHDEGAEEG